MVDKDETEELHKKGTFFPSVTNFPQFSPRKFPGEGEKIFKDLITGLDSSRHDRSVKTWKGNGSPEIAFHPPSGSNVRDKGFSTAWLHVEKNRIGADWIDWNKSFRPKTWINRMKGVEKKKKRKKKKKRTLFPLPFLLALERRYAHYYWWTSIHRAKKGDEPGGEEKKKKARMERTRVGKMEKSNCSTEGVEDWRTLKLGTRFSENLRLQRYRVKIRSCCFNNIVD